MLDPDELAEMRALQVRAYGRDGGLSDAEATRLRELERRRAEGARVVPEIAPRPSAVAGGDEAPGRRPSTGSEPPADADDPAVIAEPPADASVLSSLRVHWRPVAAAAAAVLILGVGLGWFLFGRPAETAVALTPEQQEWQTALLAEGVYDSGSVHALAVESDVVVWTATKDEQKNTCLILSDGDQTRPSCQPTETVDDDGLWGSLVLEISEEIRREVVASLYITPAGVPVARVDTMDQSPGTSSITYASEKETRVAAAIAEDGFDPNSIWVAGYDGDVPVWTATEIESQAQCLIYDGASESSPRVCADPQTMMEQESGLVLNVVDPLSGQATTFEMSPVTGPSFLVITRERGETGAGGD